MDYWDLVLNLIGKGGPILLVPSGVSILCQIHGSYSSRVMTFVFGLTSFGAEDFGGFPSSLWWIQTAFISARSLGFTSSLELTFLRFWENPILAREFIDSPPNHGVIHRFLWWVCSQGLCDRAYKIWWDLDLFWSSNRQVLDRTKSKNRVSASGWIFPITGWTGVANDSNDVQLGFST